MAAESDGAVLTLRELLAQSADASDTSEGAKLKALVAHIRRLCQCQYEPDARP